MATTKESFISATRLVVPISSLAILAAMAWGGMTWSSEIMVEVKGVRSDVTGVKTEVAELKVEVKELRNSFHTSDGVVIDLRARQQAIEKRLSAVEKELDRIKERLRAVEK